MKLPKLMGNVGKWDPTQGQPLSRWARADKALEQGKWLLTGLESFFSPWHLKGEYQMKTRKLAMEKEGDKESKQEAQSLQL